MKVLVELLNLAESIKIGHNYKTNAQRRTRDPLLDLPKKTIERLGEAALSCPQTLARTGLDRVVVGILSEHFVALGKAAMESMYGSDLNSFIDAVQRICLATPGRHLDIFSIYSWNLLVTRLFVHPVSFQYATIIIANISSLDKTRVLPECDSSLQSAFHGVTFRLDLFPATMLALLSGARPTPLSRLSYVLYSACCEDGVLYSSSGNIQNVRRARPPRRIGVHQYSRNTAVLIPVIPLLAHRMTAIVKALAIPVPQVLRDDVSKATPRSGQILDMIHGYQDWEDLVKPDSSAALLLALSHSTQDRVNIVQCISVMLFATGPVRWIHPYFVRSGLIPSLHMTLLHADWSEFKLSNDSYSNNFGVVMTSLRCLFFLCEKTAPGSLDTRPFFTPGELTKLRRVVAPDHTATGCVDGPMGLLRLAVYHYIRLDGGTIAMHLGNFLTMILRSTAFNDNLVCCRLGLSAHLVASLQSFEVEEGGLPSNDVQSKFDLLSCLVWMSPECIDYISRSHDRSVLTRVMANAMEHTLAGTVLLRNLLMTMRHFSRVAGPMVEFINDHLIEITRRMFTTVPITCLKRDSVCILNSAAIFIHHLTTIGLFDDFISSAPTDLVYQTLDVWSRYLPTDWKDMASFHGAMITEGGVQRLVECVLGVKGRVAEVIRRV
ncbi:hypothetical protein J8273_4470 [Carpediemonas membranifera]|uniref:Uncharacterized protein n=1 Tax=Carpediemonas membranifera TaxID=201153 RepID=A0A8J6BBT5_9EUKA|nr:hypothetical protein J8273_4470 [Carpediemonas membranifera]|eukprot:KAG9394107.1 hypothetical protein J8273_4470 [Carpediemonas membranifera]